MDSKLVRSRMDDLIGNFKKDICRTFGIAESDFILFVQANVDGNYCLAVNGNLNDLLPFAGSATAGSSSAASHKEGSSPGYVVEPSVLPSPLEPTEEAAVCMAERGKGDFVSFMEHEIGCSDNCESTRLNQYSTLKILREFRSAVCFSEIDYAFLYDFKQFMADKGFSLNTMAKHFKHIKRYVNVAINKERMFHYPFRNFKIQQVETHKVSLTLKEIEQIEEYRKEYSEATELGELIDGFLFSCYTGMRYSDICRLTMQHFQTINRRRWIVMSTHKTGTVVRIPLYLLFGGKGLSIVSRYRRRRGSLFRLPSNNKVNRQLTYLMRKLGIHKHITFHSGRHTNATLLLYKGVSITTVQKLLGHKDIKTTQVYSAVTDLTLVKELKEAEKRGHRRLL